MRPSCYSFCFLLFLCLIVFLHSSSFSQQTSTGKLEIYHDGWIDLNKNGVMDSYEDASQPIEVRIENLLEQMTLEEKTCQLATLYGYKRVLKDILPTKEWKTKIWKDGIGAIDEHLNSYPGWFNEPIDTIYTRSIPDHNWAMNEVQRFFIEETRLGIPVDFTNEGIRGVEAWEATNFPTQLGIGHTWNRSLVREIGRITGKEARLLGYTNVYSPILDVGFDPRWGRMEEVYGESPFLVAELGIAMTSGLQENYQVASTAKHFAIYSAPKGGREWMVRTDPKTGPRETHDLFLYPFRRVIQEAGLLGIMSSYNDYDGVPISGSSYYLIELLRKEYGFRGYVVSDSDALAYLWSKHHVAGDYKDAVRQAIDAGMNVRCTFSPPEKFIEPLRELVREEAMPMDTIDNRVRDVLRVKFLTGTFDQPYIVNTDEAVKRVNCADHQKVGLQASRESLVLLKNENALLPLDKSIKKIAVIGPNADETSYAKTHYGPQMMHVVSVLEGIRNKVGKNTEVLFAKGCEIIDENWPESEILPEPPTEAEQKEIDVAIDLARESDVAILVVGGSVKTCGESSSRTSLDLPGHQKHLVQSVYETGTPCVVVLINGRQLSINWIDRYVPAILEAWYPGSHGGTAVADVLFGDYNPGGKLTVTFPRTVGQVPLNFPTKPMANSDTGIPRARVNGMLYPFGFGLSYTTFEYSNLTIEPESESPEGTFIISFDVTNTGLLKGDEVVQLYINDEVSSVTTYEKVLRGFERVSLEPGESKTVSIYIDPDDLALWNRAMERVVEPGIFQVMVGASSEDIRLEGSFEIR